MIGDARCQLLTKNLPGLTTLDLGNNPIKTGWNNLSDLAIHSVSELKQLVELRVGTYSMIFRRKQDW